MKATADNSQMKELEGILREARNHERYLKEKKKHLTQTLAWISEKLQAWTWDTVQTNTKFVDIGLIN